MGDLKLEIKRGTTYVRDALRSLMGNTSAAERAYFQFADEFFANVTERARQTTSATLRWSLMCWINRNIKEDFPPPEIPRMVSPHLGKSGTAGPDPAFWGK